MVQQRPQSGVHGTSAKPPAPTTIAKPVVQTPLTDVIDPLLGTKIGERDRYLVESALGQGGMGRVYLGKDTVLGRQVAVKVLGDKFAGDEEAIHRFRREARLASQVEHPNVVNILDLGEIPGTDGKSFTPFFVMELLKGMDLKAALDLYHSKGTFMPWDRALTIFVQVCEALGEAHKHTIVHRDLKPENIFLVTRPNSPDYVKLLDFGIAKLVGDARSEGSVKPGTFHTQTGYVLGTPGQMSPEQIMAQPIDGRTDIYALGVVMYRVVCGRPPFDSDNLFTLQFDHVQTPPPDPATFRPDIPEMLRGVLLKTLAKAPEDRYQSTEELTAALQPCQWVPTLPALTVNAGSPVSVAGPTALAERRVPTPLPEPTIITPRPVPGVTTIAGQSETVEPDATTPAPRPKRNFPVAVKIAAPIAAAVALGAYALFGQSETAQQKPEPVKVATPYSQQPEPFLVREEPKPINAAAQPSVPEEAVAAVPEIIPQAPVVKPRAVEPLVEEPQEMKPPVNVKAQPRYKAARSTTTRKVGVKTGDQKPNPVITAPE